jgi:hypothetical protein
MRFPKKIWNYWQRTIDILIAAAFLQFSIVLAEVILAPGRPVWVVLPMATTAAAAYIMMLLKKEEVE